MSHQPYSREEHWKSFWIQFYKRKKENKLIEFPITEKMVKEAEVFSKQIISEKMKESVHQKDPRNQWKRWMTGILGEMALESFLGKSFRDKTIGNSKRYDIPDLSPLGLKVGVKSFRVGNFPLVNRSKFSFPSKKRTPLDAQIFIGISQDCKTAFILGIGFDEQLYKNESNPNSQNYVKDINALKRKTAFIEFDSLQTFNSFSDLINIASEQDSLLVG